MEEVDASEDVVALGTGKVNHGTLKNEEGRACIVRHLTYLDRLS